MMEPRVSPFWLAVVEMSQNQVTVVSFEMLANAWQLFVQSEAGKS
jgi:hypothetical protein